MIYKDIHIGSFIKNIVDERDISMARISNFFKCTEAEVAGMYASKSLNITVLMKWSKLLEYDFFVLYSQHLILYSHESKYNVETKLPIFKKKLYTKEVIAFIQDLVENKKMTNSEILKRYNIPRTTFYKWIKQEEKK